MTGTKRNYVTETAIEPLVTASEIAGLERLCSYSKQENRATPLKFAYVAMRSPQPSFLERKMMIP